MHTADRDKTTFFVFGFDNAYAGSLMGLVDIFSQVQRLFIGRSGRPGPGGLEVKLASVDGRPIPCQDGTRLDVHCAVNDIQKADVFIVTSIQDIDATASKNRFMVDWLKDQYERGTTLASICTGAFLLAETGLLDGRHATTHWTMAESFRARFPQVRLAVDKPVTGHDDLFCAQAAGSSPQLAYYLVEKYLGRALAADTAKYFIHDLGRAPQSIRTSDDTEAMHADIEIRQTQRWIKRHLSNPINVAQLSRVSCLSYRTLERRFKKATGDSPLAYIQRMRVAAAKQLLATTNLSFDEIAYRSGYENSASFRKIFVRRVNLLPSEYRKRFSKDPGRQPGNSVKLS